MGERASSLLPLATANGGPLTGQTGLSWPGRSAGEKTKKREDRRWFCRCTERGSFQAAASSNSVMDTTCLTPIILLLAAFSTTTVGQIETTTAPTPTTTETPTQDFPNNFFGTSSEDSALSDQATAIDKLTDLTDGQSATSPTSTGNGVGAASPNDIFGTENQKLNDIEADKLTKTEVHAQPENAAGIDVPALTRNETSTVAPTHSPITEAELSPANAFMRPGSIEEAASSSTGETTVSSQDDGDGVTSASSVDTVTSRVLSPEVTTPYGSDGATETAFSATNAPNALQETPPESFAAQPVHPVPFTQADVLSQSTSLPSNYGPLATDGPLVISSEGGIRRLSGTTQLNCPPVLWCLTRYQRALFIHRAAMLYHKERIFQPTTVRLAQTVASCPAMPLITPAQTTALD
ncbi:hypothetical protein MRX96_046766 [Rhipicephalus microplus]